jgi:hypothetical protein
MWFRLDLKACRSERARDREPLRIQYSGHGDRKYRGRTPKDECGQPCGHPRTRRPSFEKKALRPGNLALSGLPMLRRRARAADVPMISLVHPGWKHLQGTS